MTISQIRRRINVLKRRFALELTIIKLRRIAESVADHWDPVQPPNPPKSSSASSKPAAASPPSVTFATAWTMPDGGGRPLP